MEKIFRKIASILNIHICRRSCFGCGFLALGNDDNELDTSDRVLLETHISGTSMRLPAWEKIYCSKRLWINYEIGYTGPAFEGLEAELSSSRNHCLGWYRYRPGYSPQKHFAFQEQAWSIKANRMTVAIGAATGGIVGGFVSWLLYFVK